MALGVRGLSVQRYFKEGFRCQMVQLGLVRMGIGTQRRQQDWAVFMNMLLMNGTGCAPDTLFMNRRSGAYLATSPEMTLRMSRPSNRISWPGGLWMKLSDRRRNTLPEMGSWRGKY